MDKPSKLYKEMTSAPNKKKTRAEVVLYFKHKYFNQVRELNGLTDIDEQYIVKAQKYFIPGKIYTFPYVAPDAKELEFFDKQPMLLSFYNYVRKTDGEVVEMGINLNLIPPQFRLPLLDAYWHLAMKFIEKNEKLINQQKKQQFPVPMDNLDLVHHMLNDIGKIPYQFAVQAYTKRVINRERVRIVTYDDWPILVDYIPAGNMFVGKKIQQIWQDYIHTRSQLLQKEKELPDKIKAQEKQDLKILLRTRKK